MNMIDLKERIIVITGGARGIGYAIAERVIQSGGKVAIWDLNENMAKDSASALGSGTVAFGVNVADPVSVKTRRRRPRRFLVVSTASSIPPGLPVR